MQKLIKGKKYNTATSQRVADWGENLTNIFYRKYECLYVRNDGEFFLYASGGALTIYGSRGEEGETVIPLTPEKAREWANERGCADKLEEFSHKEDANESVNINIRIGRWEKEKLDRRSEKAGMTASEYIRRILWIYDPDTGDTNDGKR